MTNDLDMVFTAALLIGAVGFGLGALMWIAARMGKRATGSAGVVMTLSLLVYLVGGVAGAAVRVSSGGSGAQPQADRGRADKLAVAPTQPDIRTAPEPVAVQPTVAPVEPTPVPSEPVVAPTEPVKAAEPPPEPSKPVEAVAPPEPAPEPASAPEPAKKKAKKEKKKKQKASGDDAGVAPSEPAVAPSEPTPAAEKPATEKPAEKPEPPAEKPEPKKPELLDVEPGG